MAIDDTKRFTFVSGELPADTFAVVKFKGTQGISRLYEFDITLASDDPDIDLKQVLQNPATLTILGDDQDLPIHGILGQFEQLHEVKGRYFYRALLVPRLWQADLYRENQLFLDQTVPHIIEEIMRQTGLTTRDYELKLTKKYPQWEYICQYRETDFDFISRWMEREGIYYFFEQGENGEKLIITDSSTAHNDIPNNATISYFPPSGFVPEEEAIKAFICRQERLPNRVILKDYNYRKPSLDLKAEAVVDSNGRGNVYFYGEHFKTPEEGNELAKIRAEEIKCRENVFHGESTAPNICPGFFYALEGHYRESCNRKYLIVDVEHEGSQTGAFWAGVGEEPDEGEQKLTYVNRFTAIPADVQFRPERKTPKSRFYGTMNATIDAAGIGQYAELDDEGRYKVKLPFDQSDTGEGKASRWIRMSQPYAGTDHGMHFPLHKGTEVLLTFVDGDPDRPIIAGAVPNYETKSPVTAANQSESVIQTGGDNKIRIEDKAGFERIIMESPTANSWVRIGAPNDPPSGFSADTRRGLSVFENQLIKDQDPSNGIRIYTEGDFVEEAEENFELRVGKKYEENIGVTTSSDTYYDFGSSPPEKGVYVNGTYEKITKDKYTEQIGVSSSSDAHDFSSTNPKKGVYVKGNNEVVVSGDSKTLARKGGNELKIEMKDGELLIDAGSNIIKLKGSKLVKEISPTPPPVDPKADGWDAEAKAMLGTAEAEISLFKGDAIATILGASYEHFGGVKAETLVGGKFEASLAEAFELFIGAKQELAFAKAIELFMGVKLELALSLSIAIAAGAAVKLHGPTEFELEGLKIKKSDTVLENKMCEIAADTIALNISDLRVIG